MDFKTAVKVCLSKYVTFAGRARRSEYWYFVLFIVVVSLGAHTVDVAFFGVGALQPTWGLFSLAVFLPNLAVGARRLHDIDRSGWWLLIALVPVIGAIVLLVWNCTRGTDGANRFGPDPLERSGAPVVDGPIVASDRE